MAKYGFLDGQRIRKANSVRSSPPVFHSLAISLADIPDLLFIKIFPDRIAASNVLSNDGENNPVAMVGEEGIVGVELLIDVPNKIMQFYALTSASWNILLRSIPRQMIWCKPPEMSIQACRSIVAL